MCQGFFPAFAGRGSAWHSEVPSSSPRACLRLLCLLCGLAPCSLVTVLHSQGSPHRWEPASVAQQGPEPQLPRLPGPSRAHSGAAAEASLTSVFHNSTPSLRCPLPTLLSASALVSRTQLFAHILVYLLVLSSPWYSVSVVWMTPQGWAVIPMIVVTLGKVPPCQQMFSPLLPAQKG